MRLRWLLGLLLALAPALIPLNASATLLFAGGEDSDFICATSGSCSVQTGSYAYRAGWAREAYEVQTGSSPTDPPTNRFSTPTFTANSTLWLHAQFCNDNGGCTNFTTNGYHFLRFLDTNGNAALVIAATGTAGQVAIYSRTAGGGYTNLATCSSAINASLEQIDVYVHYATSGEITFYNNGAQVCDYTGDTTNGDGATALNQIEFGNLYYYYLGSYFGAWSEVIVATTDTRAMARFSAYTTGDGNTTGFTGTNICSSIWNAAAFNDTSFGYATTSGVTQECTVNGTLPTGSYTVLGLVMNARALVGGSGPQHFQFVTRTGGTDYTSSDYAPSMSFSNLGNYIQTTNPATSSAWSVSDFSASGFNVGEKTTP